MSRQIISNEFYDLTLNEISKTMMQKPAKFEKADIDRIFESCIETYSKQAGKTEVYQAAQNALDMMKKELK